MPRPISATHVIRGYLRPLRDINTAGTMAISAVVAFMSILTFFDSDTCRFWPILTCVDSSRISLSRLELYLELRKTSKCFVVGLFVRRKNQKANKKLPYNERKIRFCRKNALKSRLCLKSINSSSQPQKYTTNIWRKFANWLAIRICEKELIKKNW